MSQRRSSSGREPTSTPRNRPGRPHRDNRHGGSGSRANEDRVLLYGWHSVTAALQNPQRQIRKILATENALHRLGEEGFKTPVTPEIVRAEIIDRRLGPDAVHQGLLVEADALPSPDVSELASTGIVLVLDQITDPHNVGAILRSAAAFDVQAIVTTARHSPEATGVLAKSASGALEYVPMVTVPNLARALETMRKDGFYLVGLDSEGEQSLSTLPLSAPLALVLGAEGKGLRHLTREKCDAVARLDLPGKIKSLNVSNACAVSLQIASSRIRN